jgi:uncharacterized protein YjiK
LQSLPARDDNPGETGTSNTRFNGASGIAFDGTGRMFVSDKYNNRVQVYNVSGGTPVYTATIGTGTAGSGNGEFNNPWRIAVDGSNRLYVSDYGNQRVQQCTFVSSAWNCVTFTSGLTKPEGIAVDGSNNVYISETDSGRVLKCNSVGSCSDIVTFNPEYDVAVDSHGNIFGVDWNDMINKRDSNGWNAVTFVGVEGVPYLTDKYHYFQPRAVIDHSDNILILEGDGQRLIKLNSDGVAQWSIGVPGVNGSDNDHFSWPKDLVADPNGNIYVADANNDRIQKCASDGSGCSLFAGVSAEVGSDNQHFNWPSGLAMDPNGNIYVGDQSNHRVQKCTSSGVCTTFAGVTGESGADNMHFNGPSGIALDGSGNVYVADTWNNRVQRCSSTGICSTFAGVTGESNSDFAHFSEPWCVALDAQGRVYITDNWNNRVQVFSSNGAYLTTIGGAWGTQTGQFRASWGVALDSKGDVYIGNFWDSRIQKFALGVPGWKQANINGFGERWNTGVVALEVFNSQLYAGAANWNDGGRIWRTSDGSTWTAVSDPGFGSAYTNTNPAITDMIEFNGQLYASTDFGGIGGQIWRSPNGTVWTQVEDNGFSDTTNGGISAFAVFNNTLYAATDVRNTGATHGLEISRSSTGDSLSWTNVVPNGFNDNTNNKAVCGFAEFNGYLYASVENTAYGLEIWRTSDGEIWTQANVSGFGDTNNGETGGLAVLGGYLYSGTRNNTTGAQLWRSSNGITWTQVVDNGFGDNNNGKLESPFTFGGYLYAVTNNGVTGVEVWRSLNGTTWNQVNVDGFGDSNNATTVWSNGTVAFNNRLFIGTMNWANGGEIWQLLNQIYLPLVSGWNLVSFNLQPTSTAITDVLASIAGNYDLVYAWDASGAHAGAGNWMRYAPGIPGNTLSTLDETQGFWIRMTGEDTLEITGTAPTTTNISLSTTASGWNLVGYPSDENRGMPDALEAHGVEEYSLVYAYHADDTDTWKRYAPGVPGNDLLELAPGWGYWIKVSVEHTWTVP